MRIREEKRIKGGLVLKAIGRLPDEMVEWEDMEELKAGAEMLEKQKRKSGIMHGFTYAAVVAVCIAALVISYGLLKHPAKPDVNSVYCVPGKSYNVDNNMDLFAAAFKTGDLDKTKEKANKKSNSSGAGKKTGDSSNDSTDSDSSNINMNDMLKELTVGNTCKLPVIQDEKEMQDNNSDKKTYIVFMPGIDIYFTPSYKSSGTYILDGENGVKHYIKGNNDIYCNAGSQVYLDISAAEDNMGNVKDIGLPEWKSYAIDILAFVKIYLPEEKGSSRKEAGVFYIGRKNTGKGDLYYGMFNHNIEPGTDSSTVIRPEHTVYNKTGKTSRINKNMAGEKNDVVFYNNVPVYGKSENNKIKKYLASLPASLTEKKAKEMGIVIESYNYRKKNKFKDEWLGFYKYVKKGEDACRPGNNAVTCLASPYMAAIVVLRYTVEGDACYDYISFINGKYYVYSDSSRDKYKASSWDGYSEIGTYNFLKRCKQEYKTLDKDKYLSIKYSLFKKMDITNKNINKLFRQNDSYVNKYYDVFGYYK